MVHFWSSYGSHIARANFQFLLNFSLWLSLDQTSSVFKHSFQEQVLWWNYTCKVDGSSVQSSSLLVLVVMIKYRYCGAGDEAVEQLVKSDSILKKTWLRVQQYTKWLISEDPVCALTDARCKVQTGMLFTKKHLCGPQGSSWAVGTCIRWDDLGIVVQCTDDSISAKR
jgi:hypothetical protein